ncbi:MAG: PorT family protein [Prevotellaceae bacterium]|jgi:hypothetical protein|nr:PorT family protein [Prevotellaceae bacterium]
MCIRRLLLTVAVFYLSTACIQAQFRFGVKAGLNSNSTNNKILDLQSNYNGYLVGIAPQFKIPIIGLGVQPEILYNFSSKGGLSDYLTIPLNIRWQPLPIPVIKPIILAGPYFGYAVNVSNKVMTVAPADWGINAGIGVEFWKLQIEGRYSFGLTNVNVKIDDTQSISVKNRRFSLSLVYFL